MEKETWREPPEEKEEDAEDVSLSPELEKALQQHLNDNKYDYIIEKFGITLLQKAGLTKEVFNELNQEDPDRLDEYLREIGAAPDSKSVKKIINELLAKE
ncbi:MAG: hypothetical protein PHW53_01860 [Patescibacteria group bacterium]|nr:hypothetical protein [Patescibacteria group bacterium]